MNRQKIEDINRRGRKKFPIDIYTVYYREGEEGEEKNCPALIEEGEEEEVYKFMLEEEEKYKFMLEEEEKIIKQNRQIIVTELNPNYFMLRISIFQVDIVWKPQVELFLSIKEKGIWKSIRLIGGK